MKNNQKGFVIPLIIAIVAILAIVGGWNFYNYYANCSGCNDGDGQRIISTSTACTPNWTCGWAPCTNGYQGMTATDTNNCGLSSAGVQIACPALARQCSK